MPWSTGKIVQVEPYSGDMLPMVARSATVRLATPGPKNSTNFPTTPWRRSISVTVSTRSVAVAPSGSSPDRRTPITSGISIDTAWPSIAASASMPPTPQPSTPMPLTMGVWESVPTSVSGYARRSAESPGPFVSGETKTTRARYSRFTWWTMPVFGGTTPTLAKARWAQRSSAYRSRLRL